MMGIFVLEKLYFLNILYVPGPGKFCVISYLCLDAKVGPLLLSLLISVKVLKLYVPGGGSSFPGTGRKSLRGPKPNVVVLLIFTEGRL